MKSTLGLTKYFLSIYWVNYFYLSSYDLFGTNVFFFFVENEVLWIQQNDDSLSFYPKNFTLWKQSIF